MTKKPLSQLTPAAKVEVSALRRAKAPRAHYEMLARSYYDTAKAAEFDFARDLANWQAGNIERPDLADPRDPAVAASRAAFVRGLRDTAADIIAVAPEA